VIDPLALALTPFNLNVSGAGAEAEGLADGEGVGEGAGGELVPARPHPTQRATVAITTRACLGLKLPPHRFRALPQQVT